MSLTLKYGWYPAILTMVILAVGCTGSGSPVDPVSPGDDLTPREVLAAFADACIQSDIDTACGWLINPDRWRSSMENAIDILPFYGACLKDVEETRRERDCRRYRFRIRHPLDPNQRIIESRIYVRRVRGVDGNVSRWGIDFIDPGDGQAALQRKRERTSQVSTPIPDRTAQWGTLDTHATLLTLSILDYYVAMYPGDERFTGPRGFLREDKLNFSTLVEHPGPVEEILSVEFDIYDSMPPDAGLSASILWALIQAGSVDEDVFVGELNADGSINFTRDVVLSFDGGVSVETTNNFGDDDDTLLKGFAHFLTPINQNQNQTVYSEFDDMELFGGTAGSAVNPIDWALGQDTLGPYDIMDLISIRESRNRKTFPRAIELIQSIELTPDAPNAVEKLANAFYTFGYVLHLLEDAGIPAHVRNDMHGVPYISSIPGLGSLQPDPLEEWGESLTPSFTAETGSMLAVLMAEADPIVRSETGFPEDDFLQHLYVNAGHTDYAGVEALFEYTAFTANRLCFSEDTFYRNTNSSAANTSYYPCITDLDLDFFGKSVVYGKPGSFISDEEYIAGCGNAMFDVWRSWFWTTHWFSDPEYDDVIDALQDDWDILTVADDDDDDYFAGSVLGVREQQWRLTYPRIVRTGAALLHEFYLEVNE